MQSTRHKRSASVADLGRLCHVRAPCPAAQMKPENAHTTTGGQADTASTWNAKSRRDQPKSSLHAFLPCDAAWLRVKNRVRFTAARNGAKRPAREPVVIRIDRPHERSWQRVELVENGVRIAALRGHRGVGNTGQPHGVRIRPKVRTVQHQHRRACARARRQQVSFFLIGKDCCIKAWRPAPRRTCRSIPPADHHRPFASSARKKNACLIGLPRLGSQVWAMRWRSRGGRLWRGALYAAAGTALVFLQVPTCALSDLRVHWHWASLPSLRGLCCLVFAR